TFWGASVSNVTKRDNTEVQFLFKLFTAYFKKITTAKLIHKNKVHIDVVGQWEQYFPAACQKWIRESMSATKDYDGFQLTFLLAYSGLEEMTRAVQGIVADTVGTGLDLSLPPAKTVPITRETIKN